MNAHIDHVIVFAKVFKQHPECAVVLAFVIHHPVGSVWKVFAEMLPLWSKVSPRPRPLLHAPRVSDFHKTQVLNPTLKVSHTLVAEGLMH